MFHRAGKIPKNMLTAYQSACKKTTEQIEGRACFISRSYYALRGGGCVYMVFGQMKTICSNFIDENWVSWDTCVETPLSWRDLSPKRYNYRKYIKAIAAGRDRFWRPAKSIQFQDTGRERDLTLFVLNSFANTVITIHKMKSKNHIEQHQEGKYHSVNHNKITTTLHRITNITTTKFNGLWGFTLL